MKKFLHLKIDAKSALPVYEQVKRALKLAILSGDFKDGDRIPSIRDLALQLQINPNTVIKIYYQLEVEGFVASRPGLGYFVKLDREPLQRERRALFDSLAMDFVTKAVELGYSWDDIANAVSSLRDKHRPR